MCVCLSVCVLLTGCWGVGCLWGKGRHGHLRCLPWWRRISTQTVWLLKTETSPWAADTSSHGTTQPSYSVCSTWIWDVSTVFSEVNLNMAPTYNSHVLLGGLHPPSSPLSSPTLPSFPLLSPPLLSSPLLYTILACGWQHTGRTYWSQHTSYQMSWQTFTPGWCVICVCIVLFTCVGMEEQLRVKSPKTT